MNLTPGVGMTSSSKSKHSEDKMVRGQLLLLAFFALALIVVAADDGIASDDEHHHHHDHDHHHHDHDDDGDKELPPEETEKLEYHKGSLCGYCDYCKFCKLCDADCPCEKSPTQPNCHMCKYCKFCYLCKVCDTVCQPGGIIDRISASIFNALPRYNKDEIDKDIDGVKTWIDKKKDEL